VAKSVDRESWTSYALQWLALHPVGASRVPPTHAWVEFARRDRSSCSSLPTQQPRAARKFHTAHVLSPQHALSHAAAVVAVGACTSLPDTCTPLPSGVKECTPEHPTGSISGLVQLLNWKCRATSVRFMPARGDKGTGGRRPPRAGADVAATSEDTMSCSTAVTAPSFTILATWLAVKSSSLRPHCMATHHKRFLRSRSTITRGSGQ
jgi:hypothetical protein